MKMGTTVTNPDRRAGDSGYRQCLGCQLWYTKNGISRHWPSCPSPITQQRLREVAEHMANLRAERIVG